MKDYKLCAWMAPVGFLFFAVGSTLARWAPPPSPLVGAADIVSFFHDRTSELLYGNILIVLGAVFLLPFFVAISAAMMRMETRPVSLAGTQIAGGIMVSAPLMMAALTLATTAFRPDRGGDQTLLLSDLGWIFAVMPSPPFFLQLFAIGAAILFDTTPKPIFPKWIAYLNFVVGLINLPAVLVCVFKVGPFAWNGAVPYWGATLSFTAWLIVMFVALLRVPKNAV